MGKVNTRDIAVGQTDSHTAVDCKNRSQDGCYIIRMLPRGATSSFDLDLELRNVEQGSGFNARPNAVGQNYHQ